MVPYPFHSWGLDFIGPINPHFEGCTWILVATELFTKWVETVAIKKATGSSVANFLRENIICRFGVPNEIVFDNDTIPEQGCESFNRMVLHFSHDIDTLLSQRKWPS